MLTRLGLVVLWCLSVAGDDERLLREFERVAAAFWEVLRAPDGGAALAVLMRYLLRTHKGMADRKVIDLLKESANEKDKTMLVGYLDEIELRGVHKGRRETLLQLLAARFGPVPEETAARVAAAGVEELEKWTLRVLTAATLQEVLGGEEVPAKRARAAGARGRVQASGVKRTTKARNSS